MDLSKKPNAQNTSLPNRYRTAPVPQPPGCSGIPLHQRQPARSNEQSRGNPSTTANQQRARWLAGQRAAGVGPRAPTVFTSAAQKLRLWPRWRIARQRGQQAIELAKPMKPLRVIAVSVVRAHNILGYVPHNGLANLKRCTRHGSWAGRAGASCLHRAWVSWIAFGGAAIRAARVGIG